MGRHEFRFMIAISQIIGYPLKVQQAFKYSVFAVQGANADRVLMVKDGEAVAVVLNDSQEEVEVRVYRPLDFFGDGTTVKKRAHTASVRARTGCTVGIKAFFEKALRFAPTITGVFLFGSTARLLLAGFYSVMRVL